MDASIVGSVLVALITTIVPLIDNRTRASKLDSKLEKTSAKQSILQMIMEDEFRYETFGKFPTNFNDILDEYDVYHENGGNGKITKRVEEYKKWYEDCQRRVLESKKQ